VTLAGAGALVRSAAARGGAVAAFNVITLEQVEAVVTAAETTGRPVILQVSQNAIRFRRAFAPLLAACRELAIAAGTPVALHLDHIDDATLAHAALLRGRELGLSSLMFDASRNDYDTNVALTADMVSEAHARGVWVEAELGEIGGKDGAHAPGVRTDPDEARAFVEATGVDALAVAVGSSHAMVDRTARLDLALIARLRDAVPVPLVLHGSSGVPDDQLAEAVRAGIRKVNIGTALAVAGTGRLRQELAARLDAVDPRTYLDGVRQATGETAARLLHVVG